jgi:hypothetical protein
VVFWYVSNVYSQAACLENAPCRYSRVLVFAQPFFVVLKRGQDHVRRALDKSEAAHIIVPANTETSAYPWVTIRTSSWFQFVISEHLYTKDEAARRIELTAHGLGIFCMALAVDDSFYILPQVLWGLDPHFS